MLWHVASAGIHLRASYLNASLWLAAVVLLGLAIRSLAIGEPPPIAGSSISSATTEPSISSSKSPPATVRLYDVHDMINRWSASAYALPWQPDMSTSNNQQQNPQGGGGIGVTPGPTTQPAVSDPLMDALVQLICDDIQPEEWIASGGATATITYCNRTLIIGGSASLHRDVDKLLRNLRAADANTPIAAGR